MDLGVNKSVYKKNVHLAFVLFFSIAGLVGCGVGGTSGGNGTVQPVDDDLVKQIKSKIPPVGDDMCGLGIESVPITDNDCVSNNQFFYDGTDNTIAYILRTYGKWSDEGIAELLARPTTSERYSFFLEHNQGPLNPQCDKGFESDEEQGCKTALFGNSQYQADYLLCPNLANKYFILAAKNWTTRLNQTFVYCAAHGKLPGQCKLLPRILVTTPESLKIGDYYTYTSKELCLFTHVDGLNLYSKPSQARYNILTIQ